MYGMRGGGPLILLFLVFFVYPFYIIGFALMVVFYALKGLLWVAVTLFTTWREVYRVHHKKEAVSEFLPPGGGKLPRPAMSRVKE